MESFIKKEVEPTLIKLTDTSDASQINTIKIIYCPPTFPPGPNHIFDARVGLAFVIPPDLTDSVKDLCENQLKITPDIQNGELLLDVSLDINPRIFGAPLKGLNAMQENGHISEAFRQKISVEYTKILIETLNEKQVANKRKLKPKAEITINGETTKNRRRILNKAKKQPIDQIKEKNTFTPLFQPLSKQLDPIKEVNEKEFLHPRKQN